MSDTRTTPPMSGEPTRRTLLATMALALSGCGVVAHPVRTESEGFDRLASGPLDALSSTQLYCRLKVSSLLRFSFPSYSACLRCQFPWAIVPGHTTYFRPGEGCFPLCVDCWNELLFAEHRMPYYMQLMDKWEKEGKPDIDAIRVLVRDAVEVDGPSSNPVLEGR